MNFSITEKQKKEKEKPITRQAASLSNVTVHFQYLIKPKICFFPWILMINFPSFLLFYSFAV